MTSDTYTSTRGVYTYTCRRKYNCIIRQRINVSYWRSNITPARLERLLYYVRICCRTPCGNRARKNRKMNAKGMKSIDWPAE